MMMSELMVVWIIGLDGKQIRGLQPRNRTEDLDLHDNLSVTVVDEDHLHS